MKQAYVYHWQELSTNKWYIGSRTKKGCHPNDGYICSSKLVLPLIKSNPSNWKRTIIAVGDPKDIFNFEITLLKSLNVKDDIMSYNRHNGDGKFSTLGTEHLRGVPKPDGFGQKISLAITGRKMSEKCKKALAPYTFVKGQTSIFKGHRHSEETKKHYSKIRKGKPGYPNFAGHKHTEESKNKTRQKIIAKAINCKLTEDEVKDIKYNLTYTEAKLKYSNKISVSTIECIRGGKTWKHL